MYTLSMLLPFPHTYALSLIHSLCYSFPFFLSLPFCLSLLLLTLFILSLSHSPSSPCQLLTQFSTFSPPSSHVLLFFLYPHHLSSSSSASLIRQRWVSHSRALKNLSHHRIMLPLILSAFSLAVASMDGMFLFLSFPLSCLLGNLPKLPIIFKYLL